jgi:hypothetical protein
LASPWRSKTALLYFIIPNVNRPLDKPRRRLKRLQGFTEIGCDDTDMVGVNGERAINAGVSDHFLALIKNY